MGHQLWAGASPPADVTVNTCLLGISSKIGEGFGLATVYVKGQQKQHHYSVQGQHDLNHHLAVGAGWVGFLNVCVSNGKALVGDKRGCHFCREVTCAGEVWESQCDKVSIREFFKALNIQIGLTGIIVKQVAWLLAIVESKRGRTVGHSRCGLRFCQGGILGSLWNPVETAGNGSRHNS